MMADRGKQNKESTPPPLLLMPASRGLTFESGGGSSLLMPVPQTEASLMTGDEDGEPDSFLGQTPPVGLNNLPPQTSGPTAFNYLQNQPPTTAPDPFQQVTQPAHQGPAPPTSFGIGSQVAPPPGVIQPPPGGIASPLYNVPHPSVTGTIGPPQGTMTPQTVGAVPPGGATKDYHRLSGRPQYAQPPPGTYATSNQSTSPPFNLPSVSPDNTKPPISSHGGAYSTTMPGQPPQGPPPMGFGTIPTSYGAPPNSNMAPPTSVGGPPPALDTLTITYTPVQHHWFFSQHVELRQIWKPFSMKDSAKLEEAMKSGGQDDIIVRTDGGRYNVDLNKRTRTAIYWGENPSHIRRASWFVRPENDNKFLPFEEEISQRLERIYEETLRTHEWHRRHEFPSGDIIVMHSPNVFVSFKASAQPDEWGTTMGDARPSVVKRGIEDIDGILEGEPSQIDHLVFVVHGIGHTCDLRFRNIIECVDDFRSLSMQICKSHYHRHQAEGRVGRVEFLPIRWHDALHGDATGVDRRLKAITLNSIGKLRHYTNDTLLDILFYTSPTYAQQIADAVGEEINNLHDLFMKNNPGFSGGFSIAGHSLGALILFDLLTHQRDPNAPPEELESSMISVSSTLSDSLREITPPKENGDMTQEEDDVETLEDLLGKLGLMDYKENFKKEEMDLETLTMCEESDIKEMGIPLGPRKKIQGFLRKIQHRKDQKERDQAAEEALKHVQEARASESVDTLQSDASHSLDPLLHSASQTSIDYVMGGAGTGIPFVKYPQLKFSPANFFALGSPISMFLTVRGVGMLGDDFHFPTCPGFFNIFHPFDPVAYRLEPMITPAYPPKPYLMPHHKGRKRLHLELKENLTRMGADLKHKMIGYFKTTWKTINDFALAHRNNPQEAIEEEMENVMSQMEQMEHENAETESIVSVQEEDIFIGSLNQGHRIDYVLQEKPIESFNDYLFALGSHGCYWESEDTVLLFLKEIYLAQGITSIRPGQDNIVSSPLQPGQRFPTFPRHPMVSAGYPSPDRAAPSGVSHWETQPRVPQPGVPQPGVPQPGVPQPVAPTTGPVGPPPRAGFVRK